jgi:hypothetical protein
MQGHHSYQQLLATSQRVNWRIEDVVGGDKRLDFSRPFLPETFARTAALEFLSPTERLALNHIRARGYMAMFELVETVFVPFVRAQAEIEVQAEPYRGSALHQFVDEELKHMELFQRLRQQFDASFGSECQLIGPAEAIGRAVLQHVPLAVGIALLGLEWMSQGHYLESVKDDQELDPQFKSLLRHHWIEEVQHARLDALMLQAMASDSTAQEREQALEEYFQIGAFFDAGFRQQAGLDLAALERAIGRDLPERERATFLSVQHQALRWTFLGSAMRNRNFLEVLDSLAPGAAVRVAEVAATLC